MIRYEKSQDYFYRVSSSNWEYMVLAKNDIEACEKALLEILKDDQSNISFIAKIDKIMETKIKVSFVYIPEILHDLGYFELSKNLSHLSDFFLDKGKNPH